jgi:mRNA interferase MazF
MARLADIMRSATSLPARSYCPDTDEIIKIDFDPSTGREMAERHWALVLSPISYNQKVELCVLCPITTKVKGYPFEVPLPDGHQVRGVVLADQIKSLSWDVRKAEYICKAPPEIAAKVRGMVKALCVIP